MVDQFSKKVHSTTCNKGDDAPHVASLYIENMVSFHCILNTIVSDVDSKFLAYFAVHYGVALGIGCCFSPLATNNQWLS